VISFWRSYAVAVAWAVVSLPVALAVFFLGFSLLGGYGLPTREDVGWYFALSVLVILPAMGAVDLAVSPLWILWRRAGARSVVRLGTQAASVGLVAAFLSFLLLPGAL
jgi:hypothetical protein